MREYARFLPPESGVVPLAIACNPLATPVGGNNQLMKMMNNREEANGVNGSGTTSEAAAPGRC